MGAPPYGAVLRLRDPDTSSADLTMGITSALSPLIAQSRVATETATAPDPTLPQRSPDSVFGQNMPYIDVGNVANSYLLYKVIIGLNEEERVSTAPLASPCSQGSPDAGADSSPVPTPAQGEKDAESPLPSVHAEPWIPDDAWRPALAGEYDRLRRVIRGEPMPYGEQAPWWWAETLSAWIAAGAKLDPCEPAE